MAALRRACRRRFLRKPNGRNHNNSTVEIKVRIPTPLQRPCDTMSTSAGSPRFTTASARDSAGPIAAGSLIGPSANRPIDCASLAKSIFGFSIVVPIRRRIHAAIVPARHLLQMHDFLMISAVIVHNHQQRNSVVRRGPERVPGAYIKSPSPSMETVMMPLSRLASAAPTAAGAP